MPLSFYQTLCLLYDLFIYILLRGPRGEIRRVCVWLFNSLAFVAVNDWKRTNHCDYNIAILSIEKK